MKSYNYTYDTIKGESIRDRNRAYKQKYVQQKAQREKADCRLASFSSSVVVVRPAKYSKWNDDLKAKILEYHKIGLSLAKISKALGVSRYSLLCFLYSVREFGDGGCGL